jgi:hypothetical protein
MKIVDIITVILFSYFILKMIESFFLLKKLEKKFELFQRGQNSEILKYKLEPMELANQLMKNYKNDIFISELKEKTILNKLNEQMDYNPANNNDKRFEL